MRTVELSICALLLAAGGGWAIWLTTGYRSNDPAAAGLALAAAASLAAYYASDRKRSGGWIRFGLYSAGLSVSAASFWAGIVRPLREVQWPDAALDWLLGLEGSGLVMLVLPRAWRRHLSTLTRFRARPQTTQRTLPSPPRMASISW